MRGLYNIIQTGITNCTLIEKPFLINKFNWEIKPLFSDSFMSDIDHMHINTINPCWLMKLREFPKNCVTAYNPLTGE